MHSPITGEADAFNELCVNQLIYNKQMATDRIILDRMNSGSAPKI